MGLFSKKPKIVKEIQGGAWGNLIQQGIDVDTLSKDIRCVERNGDQANGRRLKYMRVFSLSDVARKGVTVTGWETFDQHPDLVLFEGYFDEVSNEAHLERKKT